MPQVSRRRLSTPVKERLFEVFWQTIARLRTPSAAEEFFTDLLTPTEKVMLAKRLAIALLLAKGCDYRTICGVLKVTPSTVAFVQQWYRYGGSGYKKAIKAILRDERFQQFWDMIEEAWFTFSTPAAVGSARHRRKSQEGRVLLRKRTRRAAL